jgi:hypothetical protein
MLQQHSDGKLYQIHRLPNNTYVDIPVETKPLDYTFKLTESGHTWHATDTSLKALPCGIASCRTCSAS